MFMRWLQSGLRALISGYSGFGVVFRPGAEKEMEQRIIGRSQDRSARLADRAARELRSLPFPTCASNCANISFLALFPCTYAWQTPIYTSDLLSFCWCITLVASIVMIMAFAHAYLLACERPSLFVQQLLRVSVKQHSHCADAK